MTRFDPTKPVQTRDGRKARIICTDRQSDKYPIVALVTDHYGTTEQSASYTMDGRYYRDQNNGDDLVNIPVIVSSRDMKYGQIGRIYKPAYDRYDGTIVLKAHNGSLIAIGGSDLPRGDCWDRNTPLQVEILDGARIVVEGV